MAESPNQKSSVRLIHSIGFFALGFLFTAGLIHMLIPNSLYLHADERSEKLLMLDRWKGSVFSAAFGSSHVHNGFDPRAFDHELAGTPAATHSGNLAIEGGSQTEQRLIALEWVKNFQPPPAPAPCLILLELTAGANMTNAHLVHPRSINIYDWSTAQFLSHLVEPHMSKGQKIGRIGYGVVAMVLHYTSTGMLSNWIFNPPIDQVAYAAQTEDDRRGLKPLSGNTVDPKDRAGLLKGFADRTGHPAIDQGVLMPANSELLQQLSAAAPGKHLSFVYLIMPKVGDLERTTTYPDHIIVDGQNVPIVDMAHPDLYPTFYHLELWRDGGHFNTLGATELSTRLADRLKTWYQANGEPQSCK